MTSRPALRSVELFGGAGGLALGTHAAGFSTELFVEWDRWACESARLNNNVHASETDGWNIIEGDVRAYDWAKVPDGVDLVSGGPPCQPFSTGGKARAADDTRDMFPVAVEVIRQLRPKAVLLENVKGLTRSSFANYFQLILLRVQYPEVAPKHGETWLDHLHRLRAVHSSAGDHDLSYTVTANTVNAADYGVPQQRHRVFIIAFRNDISTEWSLPKTTHSHDALLYSQWVTGNYWDELEIPSRDRAKFPERYRRRIEKLAAGDLPIVDQRWRTVRDALHGMPEPELSGVNGWHNHVLQPGARSYPGHTGSQIDLPAKTLKAGGHGVPGGENMLRRNDGSIRYFSIRESARLQTFPDDFRLNGAWGEAMRQIGNAVPVNLAKIMASSVANHLHHAKKPQLQLVS